MTADSDDVIREQIRYYSERAAEYDETTRPAGEDVLSPQTLQLETALDAFAPRGKVLEIACGTGTWTRLLATYASELTALDASAQMLELCRQVTGTHIRYLQADISLWEPESPYDVVFFANWLSHVPPRGFEEFWERVGQLLRPGRTRLLPR